jgi:hypothetical protein
MSGRGNRSLMNVESPEPACRIGLRHQDGRMAVAAPDIGHSCAFGEFLGDACQRRQPAALGPWRTLCLQRPQCLLARQPLRYALNDPPRATNSLRFGTRACRRRHGQGRSGRVVWRPGDVRGVAKRAMNVGRSGGRSSGNIPSASCTLEIGLSTKCGTSDLVLTGRTLDGDIRVVRSVDDRATPQPTPARPPSCSPRRSTSRSVSRPSARFDKIDSLYLKGKPR